jgi:hypothetical protein
MKSNLIWALAVLNVALLSALLYRASGDNTARAQAAGAGAPAPPVGGLRSSKDVLMIPGTLPSGSNAVIYLVDVGGAPHTLSAMSYTGQTVEFLSPPVDLDRLFERALNSANTGGAGTGRGTGTGTGTRGGTRVR